MTVTLALMFPGVCFVVFFALNMLIWGERSSGAVPFGTLFALCFLWFGISVPLTFVGSYFGYKKPTPEDPVRWGWHVLWSGQGQGGRVNMA